MLTPILIAAALVLIIVSYYNSLVSARTHIQAAIQEIGNQLKRQAELIPNLEVSAKAYLKHETGIIKLLADARKMVDAGKDVTQKISELLPKIQVAVESNPEIKGAEIITNLMNELRDTSDKVMYSRRSLIDLTADYNVKISTFPGMLFAKAFGFKSETGLSTATTGSHLEVSEAETKTPKVSL